MSPTLLPAADPVRPVRLSVCYRQPAIRNDRSRAPAKWPATPGMGRHQPGAYGCEGLLQGDQPTAAGGALRWPHGALEQCSSGVGQHVGHGQPARYYGLAADGLAPRGQGRAICARTRCGLRARGAHAGAGAEVRAGAPQESCARSRPGPHSDRGGWRGSCGVGRRYHHRGARPACSTCWTGNDPGPFAPWGGSRRAAPASPAARHVALKRGKDKCYRASPHRLNLPRRCTCGPGRRVQT